MLKLRTGYALPVWLWVISKRRKPRRYLKDRFYVKARHPPLMCPV
jgi:hypothetical protein